MKQGKGKAAAMLLCAGILVLVMLLVGIRLGTKHVLIKRFHMDNALTRAVFFDDLILQERTAPQAGNREAAAIRWAEKYPFPQDAGSAARRAEGGIFAACRRWEAAIRRGEKKAEDWTTERLPGYHSLVEWGRRYETLLGWEIVNPAQEIFTMPDGYLTFVYRRQDMAERIASVAALARTARENGAKLLFVQAPFKVNKYGDADINGTLDFANENADALLKGLRAEGVDVLDLREELNRRVGAEHYRELFFRTDHHWKPETALLAAEVLAGRLHEAYGMDVDFSRFGRENYDAVNYAGYFLGSQGKRMTLARAQPEDIRLYYPRYPNRIHLYLPDKGIDADGDFSLLYDMAQLAEKDFYSLNPYAAYSYGDQAVMNVDNLLLDDLREQRLLLIKDSFGDALVPFLAMGMKHVATMDVRAFDGSVQKYVETMKPDVIAVLYTAGYKGDIDWDSHKDKFDFR